MSDSATLASTVTDPNVSMLRPIPQMEPEFGAEERDAVNAYMATGAWLTEHVKTRELSSAIAAYVGVKHAYLFPNGTLSLSAALLACGIQPGDEVLVPDFTMFASATSVSLIGAKPTFVDIESVTLAMDLEAARRALTSRTRGLMLVSFNGRIPDPAPFRAFAKEHGLAFVEDAAQSLGSCFGGRHIGSFGDVGSFSFSTPKIISTGQGGALVTDRDDLAERLLLIRDFGRRAAGIDDHIAFGVNMKFTDLQAVVGLEQMRKLPARLARKREIAARYASRLSRIPGVQLIATDLTSMVPWFIDVYVERRDELKAFLASRQIGSRPVYPPIHTQGGYQNASSFPVSEEVSRRGLWLPSSFRLTDADVDRVCDAVEQFHGVR